MRMLRSRRGRRAAAAGLGLFFAASPAWSQSKKEENPQPPWDVAPMPRERPWVQWVFAFLFIAGVTAMAFKNPHRSHLD